MPETPHPPSATDRWDLDWVPIYLVGLLLVAFLLVIAAIGQQDGSAGQQPAVSAPPGQRVPGLGGLPVTGKVLPGGVSRILEGNRLLVTYAGTPGTGALGVLGEGTPEEVLPRLLRTADAYASSGRPVQPVLQLVVTLAHAGPTRSGTYSSDVDRASVQRYIDAAHQYGALLLLDLRPGRASFLEVAKRWEWALRDPLVGLVLDPEWRVGPDQVPGQQIGSVAAAEVNAVSAWLDKLTAAGRLPEKVFAVHRFRSDMVTGIAQVLDRPHLALVQQVDGVGSPQAKLESLRSLARPGQFAPGITLFEDQDEPLLSPERVLRIDPPVALVSYQ